MGKNVLQFWPQLGPFSKEETREEREQTAQIKNIQLFDPTRLGRISRSGVV